MMAMESAPFVAKLRQRIRQSVAVAIDVRSRESVVVAQFRRSVGAVQEEHRFTRRTDHVDVRRAMVVTGRRRSLGEAFEVVLFYQALWLQNAESHQAIIGGFLAGVVALLAATIAIFKLGLRIPLKYFFGITGTLLYIMAFIFAGTGINQLQASGWVPATPVEFPLAMPLLGIYPTMETLTVQGLLLCAFIATSFWMGYERKKALT